METRRDERARNAGTRQFGKIGRAAMRLREQFDAARDPAEVLPEVLAYDRSLTARSVNPGTSADLTVATLFASRLRNILPSARNND